MGFELELLTVEGVCVPGMNCNGYPIMQFLASYNGPLYDTPPRGLIGSTEVP